MDIITEDCKVVKARMRDGKGISIGTHPGTPYSYLLVIDMEHRDAEPIVVGEFRKFEDAEKAKASFGEAIAADRLPWDVNEFKRSLYG